MQCYIQKHLHHNNICTKSEQQSALYKFSSTSFRQVNGELFIRKTYHYAAFYCYMIESKQRS